VEQVKILWKNRILRVCGESAYSQNVNSSSIYGRNPMINFFIQDQVAVVTGATGVACAEICWALAEAGAKVAVPGHRLEPAEAFVAELGHGVLSLA